MSCDTPRWYTPLITLLSAQPPETTELTVSLAELEALAGEPVPLGAYARVFWVGRGGRKVTAALAQVGWRVVRFDRYTRSVTFVRVAASAVS